MICGAFNGNRGKGGLFFLPKGNTMNGTQYSDVLQNQILGFYQLHQCDFFMHDGAPAHKTKTVSKWLSDNNVRVFEWPGNSPDLNPIENCWKVIKDKVAGMKDVIMRV